MATNTIGIEFANRLIEIYYNLTHDTNINTIKLSIIDVQYLSDDDEISLYKLNKVFCAIFKLIYYFKFLIFLRFRTIVLS